MKRCALLFSAALLVRLLFQWELRDSLFFELLLGDGEGYEDTAQRLLANGWRLDRAFYQAPLYPYFLAAVHAVFGPELGAVRVVQALGGAAACVLLASAVGRFFEPRTGLLSGWLLAFYPPAIHYDATLEKTSLALLGTTAFLAALARARGGITGPRAVLLGVSIGVLSVLRENLIALFAVVAVWGWSAFAGQRVKALGLCALGLIAVQAPFVAHNWAASGSLSASSHLGPNLYIGNSATADGLYVPLSPGRGNWVLEGEDARTQAEEALGRALTPGQVSRYWVGRAFDWARGHPGQWAALTLRKLHYTLHSREWTDSISYDAVRAESRLLTWLAIPLRFGLLVPLAAVGLWRARRKPYRLGVWYACIGLAIVSVAAFFVFARYRFTLVPLLLPFASLALLDLRPWLRDRTWVEPALLIGALIGVHLPPHAVEHPRADTYNNLAGALLGSNQPERARALLEAEVRRDPSYALPYVNLAHAQIALGRLEDARRVLERAAELESPYGPQIALDLGRVLALAGDLTTAEVHFRRAVEQCPLWPEAHTNLGLLFARTGRPAEAERAYGEALSLRPDDTKTLNNLGFLLHRLGRYAEAAERYERALKLDPDHSLARANLAWLRCSAPEPADRDGGVALELAERILAERELGAAHDLLGAARAETGDFPGAIRSAERALAFDLEGGAVVAIKRRLQGYRRGEPFRTESAPR